MSIRTTSSSPSRRAPARPSRPVSLTSHRSNLNPSTSRLRFLPSRRPLSRKPNRRRRRLVSRSPRTRARRPRASSAPLHAPFPSSASSTGAAISAFNRTAARAVVHRSPRQSPSPFFASPSSRVFHARPRFSSSVPTHRRPAARRSPTRRRRRRSRASPRAPRRPPSSSSVARSTRRDSIRRRARFLKNARKIPPRADPRWPRDGSEYDSSGLEPLKADPKNAVGRSVGRSVGRRVGASRAMIIVASG